MTTQDAIGILMASLEMSVFMGLVLWTSDRRRKRKQAERERIYRLALYALRDYAGQQYT